MNIDFSKVKVYTDLGRETGVIQDLRKDFANLIYTEGRGIAAHALALKIYNGDKDTEYSEEEIMMIRNFAGICSPCIIDAFETILNNRSNEQDNK